MTNSAVPTVRPGDRVFEEARKYGSYPWSRQDFFRGLLAQDVQLLKILEAHEKSLKEGSVKALFDRSLSDLQWKISAVWARASETLKYIDSLPDSDFFKPSNEDEIEQ